MDFKFETLNNCELHYLSYHGLIDQITKLTSIKKYINQKDVEGTTPLHLACAQNHTKVAKHLISLGAEVNCQDKNLSTAVHWAAFNNNIELVKILIERNANVRSQDSNGIHPIHLAALKGHIEMFNILKSFYITSDEILDNLRITPLHLMAHCGHLGVIQALIRDNENLDVNLIDKNDITPLHLAIASNYVELSKLLLRSGAVSYCYDSYDRMPIHWAAVTGNVEVIQLLNLIPHRSIQDCLDKFKCTPLFLATIYGHDESVNILLQNNYQLHLESGLQRGKYLILTNLKGPDGVINKYYDELASLPNTLHWAAAFCSKNIFDRLLDNGDIEQMGLLRNTPLHTAASFGNLDVVEFLIDMGAPLNPIDMNGTTPLYWAIVHDHIEIVQLLLDKGANKRNALCHAAAAGYLNIVKLLIEYGSDVDENDTVGYYGTTALEWAATNGHGEIVEYLINEGAKNLNYVIHLCAVNGLLGGIKLLLERGIDVNEEDRGIEQTALIYAVGSGQINVIKYLVSIDGINLNHIGHGRRGNFPLHKAINNNNYEITKILIEHGADLNKHGDLGIPILIAIEAGNLEMVKLLVDSGADLNITDRFVDLPLILAVKKGHMDIVDYLLEKIPEVGNFIHSLAQYRTTTDLLKYMKQEDVYVLDNQQQTPLFSAILGDIGNVKFLINNGAYLNHENDEKYTPLIAAIVAKRLDCVKMLLENGADPYRRFGRKNQITSMVAIENVNLGVLKLLIEKYNLDIHAFDNIGWNLLHYAAFILDNSLEKLKILEYLLLKKINVNETDRYRQTPFNLAMSRILDPRIKYQDCAPQIVKLLFDHGADINIQKIDGDPMLFNAIAQRQYAYIKFFIKHGVPINWDKNPLYKWDEEDDIQILHLLHQAGFNFKIIPENYREKFYSDAQSFILYAEKNPLELKQLCRLFFRNTFGNNNYLKIVKCLPLPDILKQYLIYDEFVDIV